MSIHDKRGKRKFLAVHKWAHALWSALDTPVSLSCAILGRYNEWEQLATKSVVPLDYNDASRFFRDYQAVKALAKFPRLPTGIDKQRVAVKKFLASEKSCHETNVRLRGSGHRFGYSLPNDVGQVIFLAQRKIAAILGDVPQLDELDFSFGPGASFGVRGDTSVYKKLTSPLECTFALSQNLGEFLAEFPGWVSDRADVTCVPGSELTFVPKDAKTDRPICIEPLLNGLYQKGIGSFLRNRLLKWGIDLRDQGVNQSLASRAFHEGLATVDFSSASDTIAYGLVLELLPLPWFEFLDIGRCPSYTIENRWYPFQKFSSMGNAYTFELETLIFYALAIASCEVLGVEYVTGHTLSVYGDDVILPQSAFDLYRKVTSYLGFTINEEKSYASGVFFESCGTDWFEGINVRPIFVKLETRKGFKVTKLHHMYYLTNAVQQIAERVWTIGGADARNCVARLMAVHRDCLRGIPRRARFLVPKGAGDDCGIHAPFDVACPTRHKHWDAWQYYCRVPVSNVYSEDEWPLSYALYMSGRQRELSYWIDGGVSSKYNWKKLRRRGIQGLSSGGYSVRGDVRYMTQCHWHAFHWQDPAVRWSGGHLKLCR